MAKPVIGISFHYLGEGSNRRLLGGLFLFDLAKQSVMRLEERVSLADSKYVKDIQHPEEAKV